MPEVSTLRLNVLRVAYLILVVGLGVTVWPGIVNPPADLPLTGSVVRCLLGGICVTALFGLRYPLQMLPLLLFEFAWKAIWLLRFGVPTWQSGHMDFAWQETWHACLMVVILVPLVPWRYVLARYVLSPGERWKSAA